MTAQVRLDASRVLLTFDVDWAPDWMIADIAEALIRAGISATFFCTHESPVLRTLAEERSFEVGLHPNFMPGSTQGRTEVEVFAGLRAVFPAAVSCRTHSLFQSEPLLGRMAASFGIEHDCSVYLPGANGVEPHRVRYEASGPWLVRVPHVFQDNMHVLSGAGWSDAEIGLTGSGWKVLNFHPVHVALNTRCMDAYETLKGRGPLQSVTRADVADMQNKGEGVGTLLTRVVDDLAGERTFTISERVAKWRETGH